MPYSFTATINRIRANDPRLTHLDLSNKGLSDANIIELCQAMSSNTTLTSLDLSCNNIGDAGAQALADNNLNSLNLRGNQIGEAGAIALAAHPALTWLNLSENTRVPPTLHVNSIYLWRYGSLHRTDNISLTSLSLYDNAISPAAHQLIHDMIIRNIEHKKTIVAIYAFSSIVNENSGDTQRLSIDALFAVGLFLTPAPECLHTIRVRAVNRGSRRDDFFHPIGAHAEQPEIDNTRSNDIAPTER